MARTDRLFRLLQALRALPSPVTADQLADETGVSVRTLYRDIDSLRAAGAEIDCARGLGYTLVDDGTLPLQHFTRIEIEALVLGLAEVQHMGDPDLTQAASGILGKIAATLPSLKQQQLLHAVSQVHRFAERYPPLPDMRIVRESCWREQALEIRYKDKNGRLTHRRIWPLAVMYLEHMLVVLAWCGLRQGFRKFQAERILDVQASSETFRPRRAALLREYLVELSHEGASKAASRA
ncbi:YafY family protein [soil metagenome]